MHCAIVKLPTHHTLAYAIFRHHQIDGEIFDVEFRVILERLTIERMQNRMAGSVCRRTGTLYWGAFAKLSCVATEGPLIDFTFFGAREWHTVMFQLINSFGRFTGEIFHCIRVAEPIGPFDRVIHVPLPAVRPHIAKAGCDATLSRHSVRASWEHFGHASRAQSLFCHAQRRPQTCAAGPNNHNVIIVGFIFICSHRYGLRNLKCDARDGENSGCDGRVGYAGHHDDPDLARKPLKIVFNQNRDAVFKM